MIRETEASNINNGASTEPEIESHSITDADVVEALQEGIREAAREELINQGEASLYYDSLTMSPLNAMSSVSFGFVSWFEMHISHLSNLSCFNASPPRFTTCILQIANQHHISQGRYCSLSSIQAPCIPAMGSFTSSKTGGCLDTAVC
jgi:hypothetical protein